MGNPILGEGLGHLVSFEARKLASGVVLLSPFVPLLFMGDEYGETAPFQYFVSHSDPGLIDAVRRGRKEEFASFQWQGEPPDPQDEQTFERSKLNQSLKGERRHQTLLAFHKELLHLRKSLPALRCLSKDKMDVVSFEDDRVLAVRRRNGNNEVLSIFNFNDRPVGQFQSVPYGVWHKRFDSVDARWMGEGSTAPDVLRPRPGGQGELRLPPHSVLLYEKEIED